MILQLNQHALPALEQTSSPAPRLAPHLAPHLTAASERWFLAPGTFRRLGPGLVSEGRQGRGHTPLPSSLLLEVSAP